MAADSFINLSKENQYIRTNIHFHKTRFYKESTNLQIDKIKAIPLADKTNLMTFTSQLELFNFTEG